MQNKNVNQDDNIEWRGGAIDNKREMLLNHIEYVFAPTN
jgi:hypothetical protein